MDDALDLERIDDHLYHPPSPFVPTVVLPTPAWPVEEDAGEGADVGLGTLAGELDPAQIVLPPSPIPPEGYDAPGPTPTQPSKSPVPTPAALDRQCRICFGGEEDEDELGRLFSPCVCSGSMRHVHIQCLNTWRNSSANKAAFWSCPQCHFRYHFSRTRISGIATNPVAITLTTLVIFFALTFLSGHLLHLFLNYTVPSHDQAHSIANILIDNPPDLGLVRYAPTSTAFEIVRGAVGVFAGGEAEEVLRGLSALFLNGASWVLGLNPSADINGGKSSWWAEASVVLREWWSSFVSLLPNGVLPATLTPSTPSVLTHYSNAILYRLTLGISLIGSLSFISLLLSLSLLPIFTLANQNFPRFVRLGFGGGRRGRARGAAGGAAGGGPGAGAVLIVAMVAIGIVRTLLGLYKTTQSFSARILHRAETAIPEVSPAGHDLPPHLASDAKPPLAGRVGQHVVFDPPGGWDEEVLQQ